MVKASQIQAMQDVPEHLNFLGICLGNKACQERRDEKRAVKAEQKQQKIDSRTQSKLIKAQAQADLAKQGIDGSFWGNFGKGLPSILSSAGGIVSSIYGGGGGGLGGLLGGQGNQGNAGGNEKNLGNGGVVQEPKDNTGLIIGIGLGALAIIGIIVWAVKR